MHKEFQRESIDHEIQRFNIGFIKPVVPCFGFIDRLVVPHRPCLFLPFPCILTFSFSTRRGASPLPFSLSYVCSLHFLHAIFFLLVGVPCHDGINTWGNATLFTNRWMLTHINLVIIEISILKHVCALFLTWFSFFVCEAVFEN